MLANLFRSPKIVSIFYQFGEFNQHNSNENNDSEFNRAICLAERVR